jgi:hypothetical protein
MLRREGEVVGGVSFEVFQPPLLLVAAAAAADADVADAAAADSDVADAAEAAIHSHSSTPIDHSRFSSQSSPAVSDSTAQRESPARRHPSVMATTTAPLRLIVTFRNCPALHNSQIELDAASDGISLNSTICQLKSAIKAKVRPPPPPPSSPPFQPQH